MISETRTETNGHTATTAYAYGLERIAAYTADGKTGYVYDGRGSVAQAVTAPVAGEKVSSALPDVAVKVQSFSYTAFGEQMGAQKVSGFAYNAEAYDAATGMINLRARQYEPTIGRFEQKDAYPSNVIATLSINAYLFVYNSPINMNDTDGLVAKSIGNLLSAIGKTVKNVIKAGTQLSKKIISVVSEKNKSISAASIVKKVTNVVSEAVRSLSSYAKGDLKIADTIKKAQERIQALIQGGSVNEAVSVFVRM